MARLVTENANTHFSQSEFISKKEGATRTFPAPVKVFTNHSLYTTLEKITFVAFATLNSIPEVRAAIKRPAGPTK